MIPSTPGVRFLVFLVLFFPSFCFRLLPGFLAQWSPFPFLTLSSRVREYSFSRREFFSLARAPQHFVLLYLLGLDLPLKWRLKIPSCEPPAAAVGRAGNPRGSRNFFGRLSLGILMA